MRENEKPKIRKLKPSDAERIKCHGRMFGDTCGKNAEYCETLYWKTGQGRSGVSFFYHCKDHLPKNVSV